MSETIKIAGVQMDVMIGRVDENLSRIEDATREAARSGARLVVFPECALTGYCFDSLDEARPFAEPVDGPAVARLTALCRECDCHVIVGMLEADGERVFNACLLIGPAGLAGGYRKIHLPFLGIDRFVTPGDRPFGVFSCGAMQVGMNICYDISFPESSRVMALGGADLIALPTNWPPAAACLADFAAPARAMENHVYYIAVNRIGEERGFRFIGQSRICEPVGKVIASADREETILYADIDPAVARNKHLVRIAGQHEIHRFNDRRPEMYGAIVEPVAQPARS